MSCRKWEVQILRWQAGTLDRSAEASVLRHLESCAHCRTLAGQFSKIDSLLSESEEPFLPPFLKERIVGTVSEAMRQDSMNGFFPRLFGFLASLRPAVVGGIVVLAIGLGVATGWDLARSTTSDCTASSYDLLSSAGLGAERSGSSLEFIWADTNGRAGE